MNPKFEDLAFDAVIPSALLFNENIEPNAIKLYAFIRGLTRVQGYCYATNAYLAECMNCSVETVQRLLRSLRDEGFIEIETNKEGIHWQRRIFVGVNLKKSLRSVKNNTPPCQNQHPPLLKMTPNIRYIIEDKEKHTPPLPPQTKTAADASGVCAAFTEKIKEANPKAKQPNATKWEKEFEDMIVEDKRDVPDIYEMIAWVFAHLFWKSRCLTPANLRKNFDTIYLQMKSPNTSTGAKISNREWASKIKNKIEHLNELSIGDRGISFSYGNSYHLIKYEENGFIDQVKNKISKMGIVIDWGCL